MKNHYIKITTLLLFLVSSTVFAIDPPSDEELDNAETQELDVGEEQPYELDDMTVTGVQFTFEQETALRLVRQALKRPKSLKREDWNTWACWYRKPGGTHRTHLECARNGDLAALKPDLAGLTAASIRGGINPAGERGGGNWGTIMRSNRPVNKKQFEAMLDDLPGSDDFDQEFVGLALAGQNPPRDIPSDAELDSFTQAYKNLGVLEKVGGSEDQMIKAIEDESLTVNRYNRLVDLLETYQSIENEVAYRLGTLERPDE
ncbi:MAG: hypothetical protein ACI9CB_001521 [Rhodothermales bacterium]|jgi:hypothetical protein